jgi:hypothetical protein
MAVETFGSFRARCSKLPIGSSVDLDLLDGFINSRIEAYCRAFPWSRLEQQSQLQLAAEYTTGTVTISAGSTSGTGSGTTFTTAMTGRSIRFANRLDYYQFTYVSATSFTIDRALEGTTNLSAAGYRIWKHIYELPSNLESLKSMRNLTLGIDLNEVSREDLDQADAARIQSGNPYVYAPAEDSSSGLPQIEVYPGPTVGEGMPMRWRATAPLFDLTNDNVDQNEFPNWISIPCIFAGVKADLYGLIGDNQSALREEAVYEKLLKYAMAEDARRQPAGRMQIADRYTAHRAGRASRGAYTQWSTWWRDAG